MITAHGGAMNTKQNGVEYFEAMEAYPIDAIEVDVRRKGGELVLLHSPSFSKKGLLKVEYALEYCLKHNIMVNIDLKTKGLLKQFAAIAKKMNAEHCVYITGAIRPKDIPHLGNMKVYLNSSFFGKKLFVRAANLEKAKRFMESFNSPAILGLNVNHLFVNDEFLQKAKELGVALSVYTVDSKEQLERFTAYNPANITTNNVKDALALRGNK